jgi:ElaA protein
VRTWLWRTFQELSPDELYEILRLRALVFVVEQQCAYLDMDGADQRAHHLFSRAADGSLEGYLRVLAPGVKYKEPSIGRVVSHPDLRRGGLGIELMREGIRRTELEYPGLGIRINAQRRLEQFYKKLDFVTVGDPYQLDGIEHVEMVRLPVTGNR